MVNPIVLMALAAGGFGIYKALSLKETFENTSVTLASIPKIHRVDFSGIKVSIDLKVDNPAKERIKLKLPSVKLYYKSKLIASTEISNTTYTIEPTSSGKITGIIIEAGTINLVGSSIVTDFLQSGTNITQNFGFEVMLEANGIPLKIKKL